MAVLVDVSEQDAVKIVCVFEVPIVILSMADVTVQKAGSVLSVSRHVLLDAGAKAAFIPANADQGSMVTKSATDSLESANVPPDSLVHTVINVSSSSRYASLFAIS